MSRRRYISTEISLDRQVNRLGDEYGDFAVLLYTWMIPHAHDDATLHGDAAEILWRVVPGRRNKTEEDIAAALAGMEKLGLIEWDRDHNLVLFPPGPFYRYQSYIKDENKRRPPTPESNIAPLTSPAQSAQNAAEVRTAKKSAEKAVSVSSSVSPSLSPSVSSSPCRDEVEQVLGTLDTLVPETVSRTDVTTEGIWRTLTNCAAVDPLEVATDYVTWQETLPAKRRHRDVVKGWRNQMRMRRDDPQYYRPPKACVDADHEASLPRVPLDLLERTRQRTALIEANSDRLRGASPNGNGRAVPMRQEP